MATRRGAPSDGAFRTLAVERQRGRPTPVEGHRGHRASVGHHPRKSPRRQSEAPTAASVDDHEEQPAVGQLPECRAGMTRRIRLGREALVGLPHDPPFRTRVGPPPMASRVPDGNSGTCRRTVIAVPTGPCPAGWRASCRAPGGPRRLPESASGRHAPRPQPFPSDPCRASSSGSRRARARPRRAPAASRFPQPLVKSPTRDLFLTGRFRSRISRGFPVSARHVASKPNRSTSSRPSRPSAMPDRHWLGRAESTPFRRKMPEGWPVRA